MINLTEQQFKIFDVIKGHVNDYGYPPTRAEIAKIMGFKSVNAAESHIKALVKKGVLLKVPDSSRGLKLVEEYSGIQLWVEWQQVHLYLQLKILKNIFLQIQFRLQWIFS